MKVLHRRIEFKGPGSVAFVPEDAEDLWNLYNIIAPGDVLKSRTYRKVQRESETGSSSSEKKSFILEIVVDKIDFDPRDELIRVSGKNISENEFVKIGAYHTHEIQPNQEFTLKKEYWDSVCVGRVNEISDPKVGSDAGAIIFHEGLAHLCVITSSMTLTVQKIEMTIPRKANGVCAAREKSFSKFYELIYKGVVANFDFTKIKCVVIASPGFLKDELLKFMIDRAVSEGNKSFVESKGKFILAHSASGHKHALRDVLLKPEVAARLQTAKASGELKALDEFYEVLGAQKDRAYYGVKPVQKAYELGAIQSLLLLDSLFRSMDLKERQKYVDMVEDLRRGGVSVHIFSSMHETGEQLKMLGNTAAILRYPVEDLDEIDDDESSNNNNDDNNDDDSNVSYSNRNRDHETGDDDGTEADWGTQSTFHQDRRTIQEALEEKEEKKRMAEELKRNREAEVEFRKREAERVSHANRRETGDGVTGDSTEADPEEEEEEEESDSNPIRHEGDI